MQGIRTAHPATGRGRLAVGALSALLLVAGAVAIAPPAHAAIVHLDVANESDLALAIGFAAAGEDVVATVVDDIEVEDGLPEFDGLNGGSLTIRDDGSGRTISADGDDFGNGPLLVVDNDAMLALEGLTFDVVNVGTVIAATGASPSTPTVSLSEVLIFADALSDGITVTDASLLAADVTIFGTDFAIGIDTSTGAIELDRVDISSPASCGISAALGGDVEFRASGLDIYGAPCSALNAGLSDAASMTIVDSVFSGNDTGIFVIHDGSGTFELSSSTILGSDGAQFVLYDDGTGRTIISNSTIEGGGASGATAPVEAIVFAGEFVLRHSTVTGNMVSGGIPVVVAGGCGCGGSGTVTIEHTIIADNIGTDDANPDLAIASGTTVSIDRTLVGIVTDGDTTTLDAIAAGVGNLFDPLSPIDPDLGALALNGGTTPNRLPNPGSPVINAGDPAFVGPPALDQRGSARISGGIVDIGSAEVQYASSLHLSRTSSAVGEQVTATGTGFPPNTTFTMVLNSTPVTLGSAVSNSSGSFSFAFTVPTSVSAGAHTVTATLAGNVVGSAAITVTGLPDTGADPGAPTAIGALLLFAGLALGLLARRRRA